MTTPPRCEKADGQHKARPGHPSAPRKKIPHETPHQPRHKIKENARENTYVANFIKFHGVKRTRMRSLDPPRKPVVDFPEYMKMGIGMEQMLSKPRIILHAEHKPKRHRTKRALCVIRCNSSMAFEHPGRRELQKRGSTYILVQETILDDGESPL